MPQPAEENVRPWGRYDVLDEGAAFKVKRITVAAGMRLSYQSHERRSERWIVVSGRARVTLDDVVTDHVTGAVVLVPERTKHRVENPGTEMLVFIEVQCGTYFGEDDIVRYEDDFGRAGT